MLVIVCGMNRSASTLRYQIAKHLAEKAGGKGLGWEWDPVKAKFSKPGTRLHIAKVHHPNEEVESKLQPEGTKYAYSYRDIRDAFASNIQMTGEWSADDFRFKIQRAIDRHEYFVSRASVLVSRYEDWLDNIPGEIERYEEFLGVPLSDDDRKALADELSLSSQKKRIESFSDKDMQSAGGGFRIDKDSLMHKNHVRDGKVGKWDSVLSDEQIAIVHEVAGEWLVANGYESRVPA